MADHIFNLGIVRIFFILILFLAGSETTVHGDGTVISPTANARIEMPDQQALIHYAEERECLVIETRFIGPGTEFAWVVPLPAVPEISAVTSGLFPTLRYILRPQVIHNVPHLYLLIVMIALPTAIYTLTRRFDFILFYILLVMVLAILLPSLGSSGTTATKGSTATEGVHIHNRRIVGNYEATVVSSEQPEALRLWFDQNGFYIDQSVTDIVNDYVQNGWFFATIKLIRDNDTDTPTTPHPLAFTFPTKQAVYPLRLTGTHGGPCAIDLYVFGGQRAQIPGFTVKECRRCVYHKNSPGYQHTYHYGNDVIPVGHPQLSELTTGSFVVTKLSATLSPPQMTKDAYVSWRPYEPARETFYSRHSVRMILLNILVTIFCIVGILLLVLTKMRRITRRKAARRFLMAISLTVPLAIGAYFAWPKIDVHLSKMPFLFNEMWHRTMVDHLKSEIAVNHSDVTLEWLKQRAEVLAHSENSPMQESFQYFDRPLTNRFTGGPILEEDSPGNYQIISKENGYQYVWYDANGFAKFEPLQIK